MAEFWIPAWTALSIVEAEYGRDGAIDAIRKRAAQGLVKGRADTLFVGANRSENARVPPFVWRSPDGVDHLHSVWDRGDFEWDDGRSDWVAAFGVRFDFDGIGGLLSVERSAAALRALSVASSGDWLSANEAVQSLSNRLPRDRESTITELVHNAALGFVPARAQVAQRSLEDASSVGEREWDVPARFWEDLSEVGATVEDWNHNTFEIRQIGSDGPITTRLTGVYFLRQPIEEILSRSIASNDLPLAPRRGAPGKPYWEDLLIAIWGKLARGDLKPKRIADVKREMFAWIAQIGEPPPVDDTVRIRARKVFLEWERSQ